MGIRFGTDGWRAVIAEEFTFENVRRVTRAVHETMPASKGAVVVGHDTRFHSARFAREAARVLASAGRKVLLTDAPCPTPSVSCQVAGTGAPFGMSITASHNPPEFNGVKIKSSSGASASPEVTRQVEALLSRVSGEAAPESEEISLTSFEAEHRRRLLSMVDLDRIRKAGLRVVFDAMHGAAGRMLARLLDGGATSVETLHGDPDPLFGGINPEPIESNLPALRERMARGGASVGLATDGDADRIGAYDEKGRFVSPLRITPLLAVGLLKRGKRGEICKTFANTILLDRIAARNGCPFSVHPIGFKYIAERMAGPEFLIGGEESGGIGIQGYLPERDGLLISLLILETMASEGKGLAELLAEMEEDYGAFAYARRDIPCPSEKGVALAAALKQRLPSKVGRMKVTGMDDLDGVKLLFGEEGWILARASGTEPVLRVYCEAPTQEDVAAALDDLIARVTGA